MPSLFKHQKRLLVLAAFVGSAMAASADSVPLYQQPTAAIDARVEDLLIRMTPREKLVQLSSHVVWFPLPVLTEEALNKYYADGIGTIATGQLDIAAEIGYRNKLRKFLKENTRLGIPAIFHDEAAHGLRKPEATSFPAPIGLACSWNETLIEQLYDMAARESRARGVGQVLAPVVDVTLDPRWGRTDETLGEDPYLSGRLGTAIVMGLQGGASGEIDSSHVMATLKHLAGHGAPEGGLNQSPAHIGPIELRETHVTPFAMIIRAAKPAAIMPSYNEVDGVPSHANKAMLLDLVRGEYGFTGLYVSDYSGIRQLYDKHHLVATKADAARLALTAGLQMELPEPETFLELLPQLGKDPAVDALVDHAVRAVLRWKFKLGLFDEPVALDVAAAQAIAAAPQTRELALQAARESIVLLKNKDDLLPLAIERYKRIAVIGPNADVARLGSYSGQPKETVSLLDGLRRYVGNRVEILHAPGCAITADDKKNSYLNWSRARGVLPDPVEDRRLIAEARAVAEMSDLVILAIGENEVISRETVLATRRGDRPSLDLFGAQAELARTMIATGKPVILFLNNGRPVALHEIGDQVPVIIEAWYAGQETGRAAAEILFGDTNPSGKLTISFPRSAGHIPAQYRHKPNYAEFTYAFEENAPVYPFGFGLSYTTFAYKNPRAGKTQFAQGENIHVDVDLTNTGTRAGVEVAQLYVRDEVSSVTRPVKELRGFQRVSLQPGETRTIRFELTPDALAMYNLELKRVVEPGWFTIMVGGSSDDTQQVRFEVQ